MKDEQGIMWLRSLSIQSMMLFSTWPLKYLPSFSFQRNTHIGPVDLRNAGRVLIWQVILLWQEGYTPVLTHILSHLYTNPHKTHLFAAKKSPCRCCLLTEALGKVYSGRKINQNGLQVKSVMLFSTHPLDFFPPRSFQRSSST